jgi:serine/threonine protein kinase
MKKMLQKTPKQRATAHEVLEDEWLNKEEDDGEQIDIFDEQELELIRKEFTYVV